jgi:hypothetical protein
MPTYSPDMAADSLDAWFADINGTVRKNGMGDRLQVGRSQLIGGDYWINTSAIAIPVGPLFAAIDQASDLTAFVLRLTVRGTHECMTVGSGPKMWFKRATASFTENSEAGECAVAGTHSVPTVTETNRVGYEGSLATGDHVSVDLVAMVKDLYNATPGATVFNLVIVAKDNTVGVQRVCFESRHTADPPEVTATYDVADPPDAPSISLSPTNGVKQAGTTNRLFGGDFTHSDPERTLASVHIVVATDSHVDGNGKLDTDVKHDSDSATFSLVSGRWTTTRTFTQTRGTTYYWQVAVTDDNGKKSNWCTTRNYPVNQLPGLTLP